MEKYMRKKDILAQKLSAQLENAEPHEIVKAAIENFKPVAIFSGFSGGFDSTVCTHWCMNNIPGCEVFSAETGIGLKATRAHIRNVCFDYGWPYTEIRAKEDCGQDYDELCIKHGFPGPALHYKMFQRLKERPIMRLLKINKRKRSDNVMLLTGLRKDESIRRGGYKYSVIDFTGNLMYVNPLYYKDHSWFFNYTQEHNLPENPIRSVLGMSGECLCGAYAHKGEKALIKIVEPEAYERICELENKVRDAGHSWGWEDAPPKNKTCAKTQDMFMPFCVGCEK